MNDRVKIAVPQQRANVDFFWPCAQCGCQGDSMAAEIQRLRELVDRLRVELQEAHTWLEGAGIDDCEHCGYEGTKPCRFAEAIRAAGKDLHRPLDNA